MQRQEEEQEVEVNRVAEDEAVLANNELVLEVQEEEAIVEAVQAEVDERGLDASNEVDGDVDELGGGGFQAENALEEDENLERVEVTDKVGGGDAEREDQEAVGAVIFDLQELNGLVESEGDEVEHGTFEEGSVRTGEDKLEVSIPSTLNVAEDNRGEPQHDDDIHVDLPAPPKKKRRHPIIIPVHVTVLPGTPPKYRCNVCQKTFKTKSNIKYHRFCGQPSFLKPFQCPICDKGFVKKYGYEYHLLGHQNLRPYKCIFCNKGFNQQADLNRHLQAHTREKPYMCRECPGCFCSNQILKDHVTTIHKAKAFPCAQCPMRFTTKDYLSRHVSQAHSLNGNPNFECVECGKVFGVKAYRDQHVKAVHLKERPHKCKLCPSSFFLQKDLRRHLSIHTDERPIKCRICDKGFKRKDNLERHMRTKHGVAKENVADQVVMEAVTGEGEGKREEERSLAN